MNAFYCSPTSSFYSASSAPGIPRCREQWNPNLMAHEYPTCCRTRYRRLTPAWPGSVRGYQLLHPAENPGLLLLGCRPAVSVSLATAQDWKALGPFSIGDDTSP